MAQNVGVPWRRWSGCGLWGGGFTYERGALGQVVYYIEELIIPLRGSSPGSAKRHMSKHPNTKSKRHG